MSKGEREHCEALASEYNRSTFTAEYGSETRVTPDREDEAERVSEALVDFTIKCDVQLTEADFERLRALLTRERAAARTQLKAANDKLEAVRACCDVPDGNLTFDNVEMFGDDVNVEPYVLVSTLQRVLASEACDACEAWAQACKETDLRVACPKCGKDPAS